MPLLDRFPCDPGDNIDELINRHHFIGPDVNRPCKIRPRQPQRAFEAFIDVEEGPGLFPVAPDFDLSPVRGHGDFSAYRRRSLLSTVVPAPLRAENVVVAGDPDFHPVIAAVGEVEPLTEQLLPSVFTVRGGWIGTWLLAIRIVGIELIVLRVDAGRGGIKNSLVVARVSGVNDVQVDARRVVHHVRVMFTGEDVARSPHVGRELIDFVETAVDHMSHEVGITKVADHEVIGFSLAEPRKFKIGTSHPKAFPLQPLDKMMTDEATGPTNQCSFSVYWLRRHFTAPVLN